MSDVLTDLQMAGYSPASSGDKRMVLSGDWAMINCIFHNEDTPSLGINTNGTGYNCFGCGASGHYNQLRKVMLPELYGEEGHGIASVAASTGSLARNLTKFKSAVEHTQGGKDLSEKISRINDFEQNQSIMWDWQDDWRGMSAEFLQAFGGKYWQSRELDRTTEELINVPRLFLPFKHPRFKNLTIGYAARRLDDVNNANAPKYRNSSVIATKSILYLLSAIKVRTPIVVVEGPFDALKLWYYGIPAVASLGTNQWSDYKTSLILSKLPSCVVGLGDGDDAGRKFNNVLFNTFRHFMPSRYFQVDLPEGLDPGGFDDAWLRYLYDSINAATNGQLDRMREQGQSYIQTVSSDLLAAQL